MEMMKIELLHGYLWIWNWLFFGTKWCLITYYIVNHIIMKYGDCICSRGANLVLWTNIWEDDWEKDTTNGQNCPNWYKNAHWCLENMSHKLRTISPDLWHYHMINNYFPNIDRVIRMNYENKWYILIFPKLNKASEDARPCLRPNQRK